MTNSLYNPFMPSLGLTSRIVFGGGGGPSEAEIAQREAAKKAAAEIARKKAAAEAAAKKAAAEEAARKEAARKAAAEKARLEAIRKEEERKATAIKMAQEAAQKRVADRKQRMSDALQDNRQAEAEVVQGIDISGSNAVERRIQQPTPAAPAAAATQSAAGTMTNPIATATESAIPEAFTYRPDYTGTTMDNLTSASQQGTQQLIENVMYTNELGQTVGVTEVNGEPTTYVPPGFTRIDQSKVLFDKDYQEAYNALGGGDDAPWGRFRDGTPKPDPNSPTPMPTPGLPVTGVGSTIGNLLGSGGGSGFFGAFAEGGTVADMSMDDMALEGMYRMASKFLGYNGPKTREALEQFQQSSPGIAAKMDGYSKAMVTAANKGGLMKSSFAAGGLTDRSDDSFQNQLAQMTKSTITQTMQPRQSTVARITPQAADFIAPTAGQATPLAPMAEAATVGSVTQALAPTAQTAATVQPATAAEAVQQMTSATQAAQGTVAPQAQVDAQQQVASSVSELDAAQGQAILMDNPVQREIQQGELISGAADAQKAAQFTEQVQAAEATPTKQATVQGQLEGLMQQFEGGDTPAWAAGSMRQATQMLAARGLGASSMAGQAVIQATMEAALPIAQMDAQTQAQFESQNLSNRQQRAMLAAQQRAQFLGQEFDQAFQARVANSSRIGDIANMNFTAEQQVALENSRAANTMNLNNLSNRQAMVIAEASALANMDMSNLNNRQQAAVQNAQSFLQMDMANLSNEQQTAMFKAQQNVQSLFTDQAATNAAAQFNASSENQTNQFFANLSNQTSQFNAAQSNAMNQFNVNSVNALREFNAEVQQQRDLFNAQNGLVVAQANAQWRQNIATINTAEQNESNMNFAKTMNALTSTNLDAYWQRERDLMSFAYASAESAADRIAQVTLQELSASQKAEYADQVGKGSLTATLLKGGLNYLADGSFF